MNLEDMTYNELRSAMRTKGLARAKADHKFRDDLLAMQAVLDIRARERVTEMYKASIGPDAVSAIVGAALAEAEGDSPQSEIRS